MIYGLITVDYEDYGQRIDKVNAENNVFVPSDKIMEFFSGYNIPVTFFVNVAEILAYRKFSLREYFGYENHLKKIIDSGHDVQMHFHPEWLFYKRENDLWIRGPDPIYISEFGYEIGRGKSWLSRDRKLINLNEYKEGLQECFDFLNSLNKIIAYRGAGYQIFPLEINFPILYDMGVRVDSSIYDNYSRVKPELSSFTFDKKLIYEVPIVEWQNKLRWDMSQRATSVYQVYNVLNKGEDDFFMVMMGHCKQKVYFDNLREMLEKVKSLVTFITFKEVINNEFNDNRSEA